MIDFLKTNRIGQILEIVLELPMANALEKVPRRLWKRGSSTGKARIRGGGIRVSNNVGVDALRGRLAGPCYEIIPLRGIEKKVERTQAHEI